jgi:hypothetical protein
MLQQQQQAAVAVVVWPSLVIQQLRGSWVALLLLRSYRSLDQAGKGHGLVEGGSFECYLCHERLQVQEKNAE